MKTRPSERGAAGRKQRHQYEPRFSSRAAPVSQPLPLWILYPLFFAAIYLAHWPLLHLPYYWDEAGYYIPAALDLLRTGSLIPHSTLTNAHPPLPSILLAGWWRLSGFTPLATRTLVCLISAAALLGVFRLARNLSGSAAAATVTMLTALYPVWFVQSTLAHADIFAAAFTLWALSFYVERFSLAKSPDSPSRAPYAAVAILFSLAALAKETAIVTPVVLALWEAARLIAARTVSTPSQASRDPRASGDPEAKPVWLTALILPVVPLALWYLYHFHKTGFIFGNPEFLRYNATANLAPGRVLLSLWHRFVHLTVHMNLYVPVLCTVALLPIHRPAGARSLLLRRPVLSALGAVVLGNAMAFSVLGGALLTRYLLSLYPLILLVCVSIWQQRVRRWGWIAGLTAVAFLAALTINPPYAFAPEDNLTYRDMIVLHQQAIQLIENRFPQATVLSAWPATAEMEHPELGYTRRPLKTDAIEDFSPGQIEKAAADPGAYDTALIFSTKWVPPPGGFNLGRTHESSDTRFFDFHRDVSPTQAAAMLHGDIVWQRRLHGEWAAVLRFPRVVEARAQTARLAPGC